MRFVEVHLREDSERSQPLLRVSEYVHGLRSVSGGLLLVGRATGPTLRVRARAYRALARSALRYIQFISQLSCSGYQNICTTFVIS